MTLPERLADDLRRYVEILDRHFGDRLVSVVLFGSWARGTAKRESDVDVLVVVRGLPVNRWKRYDPFRPMARAVSDEFAAALAVIALTPEEAATVKPYYLGMLSGYLLLADRGSARPATGKAGRAWRPSPCRPRRLRILGPETRLETRRCGEPVTSEGVALRDVPR